MDKIKIVSKTNEWADRRSLRGDQDLWEGQIEDSFVEIFEKD